MTKKVVVVNQGLWPWRVDKNKTQDELSKESTSKKPSPITAMKRKKAKEMVPGRLQPITNLVRNSNGEISKRKVENLIHSLEEFLKK